MSEILIVDDEKKMITLLQAILEEEGYRVRGADSGGRAVAILMEHPVDIVLTDLRMAPIDGMEVLKAAKRFQPECEVVMMTAYASAETAVGPNTVQSTESQIRSSAGAAISCSADGDPVKEVLV